MGILGRKFGGEPVSKEGHTTAQQGVQSSDQQAIERYRYMLRTAPPETIEQAHAEAFARLTPEQRRMVLEQLRAEAPPAERAAVMQGGDNPQSLARMATRAEVRQPGTMERMFGRAGGGAGFGGMLAGSLLGSIAGTVIGSMVAQQFFANHVGPNLGGAEDAHGSDVAMNEDAGDYASDDIGGDLGGGDFDV
jgi:hypothetical protein